MINAKGIVKKFGDFKALDGFEINVEKGSIYGLVGPNGAGKTTIINHLTGVYRQDKGTILIDGEDIWENSSLKQKVLCINDEWCITTEATPLRKWRNFMKAFTKISTVNATKSWDKF